jgi:hypothetical protein
MMCTWDACLNEIDNVGYTCMQYKHKLILFRKSIKQRNDIIFFNSQNTQDTIEMAEVIQY